MVVVTNPQGGTAIGTSEPLEVIFGLEGKDTLYGMAGNDILVGGGGQDLLSGIEMVHMMRKRQARYAFNDSPSLAEQFAILTA